ncbi:MAG: hypothetical protein ACRCY3_11420 [Sphingorhabdus sp.]
MTAQNTAMPNGDFGYIFVGSYLNQCARVEAWTLAVLQTPIANARLGKNIRIPYLFGQKLKAVSDLVQDKPELFSKPKRVIELMARFAEPAKLRSNLAHASVMRATNDKGSYFLFHTPGTDERYWFDENKMREILVELKKLVKEITDQKMKTVSPASSQPRPSPAATADP